MNNISFINNKDILFSKFYNFPTISNDILDTIDDFILIVDFPNLGGGVTFFMDTITSYYKKNSILVIVRSYEKMLHVFINNEYILETKYDVDESILFIEKYRYKIKKILFNHTLHHQKQFIDKLFSINKHNTYITHDFHVISNKPQAYYGEIHTLHKTNNEYIDLNLFDTIITQNEANIDIFKPYYNNQIVVIELPDFKNTKELIKTNNKKIVVGIMGAISIEKGRFILANIINSCKDPNIEFVVFGYVEVQNFTNYHPYKNIEELNDLLIKYNPNLFIELSLWPETYSYTLSLCMITQLPIIYLNKRFPSVIQNRLSNYNKKYSFKNFNELYVLLNKHKQDFFYTIEENIYFDKKWSDYFNNITPKSYFNNISGKNIVFITSKIIVSNDSFSYIKKRSCYTQQERMTQTMNTIKSIRKYIPDSHIVLLDNSILNLLEKNILDNIVDTFINITNNDSLNYYTNVFQYKAFGEMSQQLQFLELFLKTDYTKIRNFFKITGRYEINETFDYNQYDNNLNIFKKVDYITDRKYYYTCFYKLDKSILKEVQKIFLKLFLNKKKYMNDHSDFEVIFPYAIINKINLVDNLGIIENIGVWKQIKNI